MDKYIEKVENTYSYNLSEMADKYSLGFFRFFVFDDKDNKRWIVYDRKQGCYLPPYLYGNITIGVLNEYKNCMDTSKKYKDQLEVTSSLGFDGAVINQIGKIAKTYEKEINDLFKICSGDNSTNQQDLYNFWLLFRYAPNEKFTDSILSQVHSGSLNGFTAEDISREYEDVFLKAAIPYCGIQMIEFENATFFCDCYASNCFANAFYYDLFYMLFGKGQRQIKICKWCGSLFFSEKNSEKYCAWCGHKENARRIANANRKNNSCRYLHKKICDKLSQAMYRQNNPISDETYENFRAESNYYWKKISGKNPAADPRYTANIQSEDDYMAWLEKQKIKYSIKGESKDEKR